MQTIEASTFPPSLPMIIYRKKISHRRAQQSGTVRGAGAFYFFTLHLLAGPASGRASRAEQTSQIFSILGSLKFIRHVRCYSNSGQNVAVPRLSALCRSEERRVG